MMITLTSYLHLYLTRLCLIAVVFCQLLAWSGCRSTTAVTPSAKPTSGLPPEVMREIVNTSVSELVNTSPDNTLLIWSNTDIGTLICNTDYKNYIYNGIASSANDFYRKSSAFLESTPENRKVLSVFLVFEPLRRSKDGLFNLLVVFYYGPDAITWTSWRIEVFESNFRIISHRRVGQS